MKRHLSQPVGVGAFEGQQGMSPAFASAVADTDISSFIADIDASDIVPAAMAGRATGANASPTITRTATKRPMSRREFMVLTSHRKGQLGKTNHFTSLLDSEACSKAPKIHTVNSSLRNRVGELSLGERCPNRQTPWPVAP
jgi:hypothetical protein